MTTQTEPQLAAPGGGLPTIELFVGSLFFALRRLTGSRSSFDARMRKERDLIRALVSSCDSESAAQRVLISRPRGLEDSSRYWSVWMTLDHLRIVNLAIAHVVGALAEGLIPKGEASTAAVKPSKEVTAAVVIAYEASVDALIATVAASPNLNTSLRYAHPWFGPLNAAGWNAIAGIHMGIHRVQIERILAGLKQENK